MINKKKLHTAGKLEIEMQIVTGMEKSGTKGLMGIGKWETQVLTGIV